MTIFTLIAYSEGSSYTDRGGEWHETPSNLEIFATDSEEEAAKMWAMYKMDTKYDYDEIKLLINGLECWDDTEFDDAECRIDVLMRQRWKLLDEEKKASEARQKEIDAQLALTKMRRIAKEQELAERAEYTRLQRKFGGK